MQAALAKQPMAANAPPPAAVVPVTPLHAVATLPAAPSEAAAEQFWESSICVAVLLSKNGRAAAGMPSCTTLRDLLEAAHAHRQHLPLPADVFFEGDIGVELDCANPVAVSIESINRVRDSNRGGHNRIDLLVYDRSSAVTRHHPGRRSAENARRLMIPHGSRTYSRAIAPDQGVGAALHVHTPIMEAWRRTTHPSMEDDHVAAAEHDEPQPLVTEDILFRHKSPGWQRHSHRCSRG